MNLAGQKTLHRPVLLKEIIQALAPRPGGCYIDATLGGGGHAEALLRLSEPRGRLLGLDADPQAVERARARLSAFGERCVCVHANFDAVAQVAESHGFKAVNGILLDLGFSSDQVADPARGFSFQAEGPLDMRFNPANPTTAADLVNTLARRDLADLLFRYGEEHRAWPIAQAIVMRRPLRTTGDLVNAVMAAVGGRWRGIHPATRTFQALRIAVNDELGMLERALPQALDLLAPGGRLAVITFHSLEDRIVKDFLRREAQGCICPPGLPVCTCHHQATLVILTRKPITPSAEEVSANPRARSAKLRVAERI